MRTVGIRLRADAAVCRHLLDAPRGANVMLIRAARSDEAGVFAEMSRRVQDALAARGSLQQFGPLAPAVVAAHIAAGTAYVLEDRGRVLGGVFVAPVTSREHQALTRWGLDDSAHPIWFLEKLMIEPAEQGRRLGDALLAGIKDIARQHPAKPAIVLDCWAGNDTLRAFYARNGFRLHGVFPAGGFEVAVFVWNADEQGSGELLAPQ